jgi:hypothetical protein
MDIDPMEIVEPNDVSENDEKALTQERQKNRLNTLIAISVALLATFIGICKIKDDNIVQAMQQAQASRIGLMIKKLL